MFRQPRHRVDVQVGEPLGLGELHEVGLRAAGDRLQGGSEAVHQPTQLGGRLRRQHVRLGGTIYLGPLALDALGLLDGVAVLPHYTSGQVARAQDWSERSGVRVIGVPEQAGLVVRGGEVTPVGGEVRYFPA